MEDEEEEDKVTISTEILPFTPLVFEIWVVNEEMEDIKHNPL
jgi:hypothetical protein